MDIVYSFALVNKNWTRKNKNATSQKEKSDRRTSRKRFAVLFWRQVVQRVCRTLFIEENDVIINFILNGSVASHVQIHKKTLR